ncbi:MAG: vitamin B12 dependent-methionine synthase activation domain-containing protein [Bacteroidota bacterium]|nr:vitamin B12 dependent-methionine synthase activation domain-containing protein [Bacteroidota bacterium]
MRVSYPYSELLPGCEALAATMGYAPGEAPEPVTELIRELSEELVHSGEARAEYIIFDSVRCDRVRRTVEIEGIEFDVKPIIFSQVKEAAAAALFICTAGPEVGERSRRSMSGGDLLRGYVYDVIGSEVAENAAERMQDSLRAAAAATGMNITNRFSPGYCGWDVAEQHKLFSFFPDNFCGITLTDSALMNPVKSVSGIIGLGAMVRHREYPCRQCGEMNCIYRRRRK